MSAARLTPESIQAARNWFAANALACIAEVKEGRVVVNDPERYFADCRARHDAVLRGESDHTFALLQRAHYLQTGEMRPLLP